MRHPGLALGRGPDARLHERRGARRDAPTGELHLWSRCRDELWHKGATSGNTQAVKAIRYDCDGDALLALVEPAGPACHTGERTCFHRGELEPPAPHEVLPGLERTIADRAASAPEGSYTAALLADPAFTGAKVEEEAEEVARAAREETDERVAEEAADVLYHLAVLLRGRGLSLADAEEVLGPSPLSRSRGWPVRARRSTRCASSRADHNLVPSRQTFLEDCETPVSAFLKLRGAGPGVPARVGRPGPARRALVVHRLPAARACSAGRSRTAATRTRSRRPRSPPPPGPAARPAAVRRRRGRLLRLRLRARRRAARRAEPGPGRPARPRADAHRRARRLRPPQAHGHDPRQRLRRGGRRRRRARARARGRSARSASGSTARSRGEARRPGPRADSSRTCRASSSRRW